MTYDVQVFAAVVYRHIATQAHIFLVGEELVHEHVERIATLLEYTSLAVLSENDVLRG